MQTRLIKPMTYFILGVPRSGTTILCNLFNALEDGFCLGEPHWYAFCKLDLPFDEYEEFVGAPLAYCKQFDFLHPEWLLRGYKETYRLNHRLSSHLIKRHLDQVNFFLIVFRDPVLVHSSQRALGWKEWDRPEDFNASYKRLDELAQHKKGIPIVYEDFVKAPLEYLNKRLPFWIDGPLELKPTGHSFGDPFANRSTEIVQNKREICLTDDEIKQHAPGREIWLKYRS